MLELVTHCIGEECLIYYDNSSRTLFLIFELNRKTAKGRK